MIGIVTGSPANSTSPRRRRLQVTIGKDVVLKNMPIAEQLTMARGIAAVVPWEPSVTIITDEKKTGREIDTIFPYNFYEERFYVRQELIDNVSDVVQAISDAFMEATLWIRLDPEKAADFLAAEPMLKSYGRELLLQQTKLYKICISRHTVIRSSAFGVRKMPVSQSGSRTAIELPEHEVLKTTPTCSTNSLCRKHMRALVGAFHTGHRSFPRTGQAKSGSCPILAIRTCKH